jgi:hypothetical protein
MESSMSNISDMPIEDMMNYFYTAGQEYAHHSMHLGFDEWFMQAMMTLYATMIAMLNHYQLN